MRQHSPTNRRLHSPAPTAKVPCKQRQGQQVRRKNVLRAEKPSQFLLLLYLHRQSMGTMGCGCLYLVGAIGLLVAIAASEILPSAGIFIIFLFLVAGGIGLGIKVTNDYKKWKEDQISELDSELADATSDLTELNKALSWYDNLPKAERDKFDAAIRAEEQRQMEEQRKLAEEQRRRESICPQCGKEWALSTSWETVNTHSEFRTEIKDDYSMNRTGSIVTNRVPVQIQTLVTTEREITKCSYCNYRREGQSRESRREIR